MIIGVGTDIIDINRILSILKSDKGEKFQEKYFHPTELATAHKFSDLTLKACCLAKRFAAKEAFVKAIGTGVRTGVVLKDIYVTNDEFGRPHMALQPSAEKLVKQLGYNKVKIDLSLSDEYPMALAFVILSTTEQGK